MFRPRVFSRFSKELKFEKMKPCLNYDWIMLVVVLAHRDSLR